MEVPSPAQIVEGDRLKWRFPDNGLRDDCTVSAVHSFDEEGVSVYVDFMMKKGSEKPIGVYMRHVKIDWLTHWNGKRLDQAKAIDRKHEDGRHGEVKEVDLTQEAGAKQVRFQGGEEPEMAKSNGELKTSTRKSLDEMSESHRQHIEKWEPHLEQLKAEHVWAAVSRVPGRGVDGPMYVAIKRGAKDYAIVDYDTEKQVKVTPKRVLEDGFESSTALMEAFKPYRVKAKEERNASKTTAKPKKAAVKKPTRKAPKKAAAKKAPAKKPTRKPASKK